LRSALRWRITSIPGCVKLTRAGNLRRKIPSHIKGVDGLCS
jgi:hypothetical protein